MSESVDSQYEKMTETPVSTLVVTLGIPTIISMLVTNIYNVADTYFVGQVGTSASGAVGVAFGLQCVIQAAGFTLGHGAGSFIARQLGEKKVEDAKRFAATSFHLSLLFGLLLAVLGNLFLEPLCRILGSTDTILPHAMDYSRYILFAAPAMMASCVTNNILRYEGKAVFAMIGLTSGGILNIFGDWLLVPRMGVAGAGLATMVSQYMAGCILTSMFLAGKTQSKLSLRYFTPKDIPSILAVGSPSFMRQGLNSISTIVLNHSAGIYGDAAIAAMAIVGKVTNFLFCIAVGIGQGFQPVSAFNYGAGKYKRVHDSFFFAVTLGTIALTVIGGFGFAFASPLVRWMRDDDAVALIGTFALHSSCVSLPFLAFTVIGNMLFQSIGDAPKALFLASLRSGLCFIPLVLLLQRLIGLLGIQIAQPLSNVLSSLITIPFVIRFFRGLEKERHARIT